MVRRAYPLVLCVYLLGAAAISLFFLLASLRFSGRQCPPDNGQQHDSYHHHLLVNNQYRRRTPYRRRENMGQCPPAFGKVTVLVLVEKTQKPLSSHYGVSQGSLECYLKSADYVFKRVDLDEDPFAKHNCSKYKNLFFRKHCIASHYLPQTDWMLVLDADTGVVNPNHCIEEWIDDRVNLVFYERFWNWEIMSGNYLVKNSEFSRKFLIDWAEMEFWQPLFSSSDNGALQLHILKTVLPTAKIEINVCRSFPQPGHFFPQACETYWNRSADYDTLMAYTQCVRAALGATRIWSPKLRIMRRGHGFARDWFMTDDGWCEHDFMFHGWKALKINSDWLSPFYENPDPSKCRGGFSGWHWRGDKVLSVEEVRSRLAAHERSSASELPQRARVLSHLTEPEVGPCYPHCDDHL